MTSGAFLTFMTVFRHGDLHIFELNINVQVNITQMEDKTDVESRFIMRLQHRAPG